MTTAADPSNAWPRAKDDRDALHRWLQRHGIAHTCVVSPHLDDAVFSLGELLQWPHFRSRSVMTVFTQARADSDARHSVAMGFSDPLVEFAARRQEDELAMQRLRMPFTHAGAFTDRFTPEVAHSLAHRILAEALRAGASAAQTLVLLPAGAGGVLGPVPRLMRRLRRLPMGCPPHAEHAWVRDGLQQVFKRSDARLGYYAELPYLWGDNVAALQGRLSATAGQPLQTLRIVPDVTRKLALVSAYASQVASEFGVKEAFQRRSLALPEAIVLPG
jgi:hypothetical protein